MSKRWAPPKCTACAHSQLQHGDKHRNHTACLVCPCQAFRRERITTIEDRMSGFRQAVADAKTFERGVADV